MESRKHPGSSCGASTSGLSTGNHSSLLSIWRQLHLQDRLEKNPSASAKADLLRNLLVQVQYATANDLLSNTDASTQYLLHADRYCHIVDSPEENGGLNNFAEGAMALLTGKRNESQKWTSSLSVETANQLPCVQNFFEVSKVASRSMIPPGRENDPLPIGRKAVPHSPVRGLEKMKNIPNPRMQDKMPSAPEMTGQQQQQPLFKPAVTMATPPIPSSSSLAETAPVVHHQPNQTSSFWTMGKDAGSGGRGGDEDAGTAAGLGSSRQQRSTLYSSAKSSAVENAGCQQSSDSFPAASRNRFLETNKRQRSDDVNPDGNSDNNAWPSAFKTAKQQLAIDHQKKYGGRGDRGGAGSVATTSYGTNKRSLGTRRGPSSKFVPPVLGRDDEDDDGGAPVRMGSSNKAAPGSGQPDEPVDERLRNIEPKMIELISSEIMDHGPPVSWDDIAGLEFAKKTIKEIVVWPMLRPDIFTGLRGPPKGLLLFGPPGTGKTLIGKCIASQSKSTFFSISASSLTSKWVGEGEKMVRALFAVARVHQPAVIFIDEIDSLLSQRSDGEHEASRRIKTEFLVQLDGATTGEEDRVLVVGATNRPKEIDEAARRRFVKRLYIPLPEGAARRQIVRHLMTEQKHSLADGQLDCLCDSTDGYSGADMANLCREAALGPIRCMAFSEIEHITADQVRPIIYDDFQEALKQVRASVSEKDLDLYIEWNKQYGSWGM